MSYFTETMTQRDEGLTPWSSWKATAAFEDSS
jgi:hypothetical protein